LRAEEEEEAKEEEEEEEEEEADSCVSLGDTGYTRAQPKGVSPWLWDEGSWLGGEEENRDGWALMCSQEEETVCSVCECGCPPGAIDAAHTTMPSMRLQELKELCEQVDVTV